MTKRVLVACGTSIATATVVAEKIKEIAKEVKVPVVVAQCKASEIRGRISTFPPAFIVANTPVPKDLGVPVLSGIPFLSGVGADKLKAKIIAALKEN
ncbi:MAG: PTS galactitol transporter subunit IIB [Thermoprotei archaeon]|nr:MAG: PTS galactitol transporter subunit IIB [Thermoprotei archaeon]